MVRKLKLACYAEFLKLKRARIVWVTFLAFALAPLMGGIFILILTDPQAASRAVTLAAKAEMLGITANWPSYLKILTQAMGVGGVLIFGFVASWIFGREYSDDTVKDLLALPVSARSIINAKYVVYIFWGLCLAISNLIIGVIIGLLTNLGHAPFNEIVPALSAYAVTTMLTLALGPPVALHALLGRGYLAPIGFVVATLVFSQIIAASGYGGYFPWSVPALHSGLGEGVPAAGYVLLMCTGAGAYFVSISQLKND